MLKSLTLFSAFCVCSLVGCERAPQPVNQEISKQQATSVDRSKVTEANFKRLKKGMRLDEVEAILGQAGPSYSSDTSYDYYIWKGKNGWARIWVVAGKVTRLVFDPSLSTED